MRLFFCIPLLIVVYVLTACSEIEPVRFSMNEGSLEIYNHEVKIGEYVFNDPTIKRPYLAHIKTRNGIQITRNHPPTENDKDDHATMHPGIWMAFGDISGNDYWRNKAEVKHVEFSQHPRVEDGIGQFKVLHHYLNPETQDVLCTAEHEYSIEPVENGMLFVWSVKFTSDQNSFVFGDQEEMGLGVRVATPFMVENGGEIINAEGLKNGKDVWGKQSNWCVYQGEQNGNPVGVMIMPSPQNFRQSWFHARDYGLLVANPFGKKAFTDGQPSHILVQQGESLPLQFGIFIFEGETDFNQVYQSFVTTHSK